MNNRFTTKTLAFAAAAGLAGSFAAASPGTASANADAYSFGYEINNRRVVPSSDFAAKVSVIGAAITYGQGGYDIPVTLRVEVGSGAYDLFGNASDASDGNLNDHSDARHLIMDETFVNGEDINLTATSWVSGNSGWERHLEVSTADNSAQVKVLRNGDAIPDIPAFDGQTSTEEFLGEYLDTATGTVDIADDQVIYLFELGNTDPSSSGADFQDLVVLITLGDSPEALEARDAADLALYD